MPDSLVVHLNRDGPHSIEAAAGTFETDGPFDILLENHGTALHAYVHFDDDLSSIASIDETNHYVASNGVERVPVSVDRRRMPGEGRMKIVTGYGSETAYVSVSITEPGEEKTPVDIDERLSEPRREPAEPEIEGPTLPIVTLGVITAFFAGIAALVVGGTAGAVGFAVVLLGIGIAVLVFRD